MSNEHRPIQNNPQAGGETTDSGTGAGVQPTDRTEGMTRSERCFENIINDKGQDNDHNAAPQIVGTFLNWFA